MVWVRPSIGLFFGITSASKDEEKGSGGIILGDIAVQLGGLLGGIVGFGERWGVFTGLMGALALIPFLGFGFIGIPIGIHYKKKWGLGLIFPLVVTEWYVGLIVGLLILVIAILLSRRRLNGN